MVAEIINFTLQQLEDGEKDRLMSNHRPSRNRHRIVIELGYFHLLPPDIHQ